MAFIPPSQVVALSAQEYQQTLATTKASTDATVMAAVETVGKRIAQAAEELMREQGREQELATYQWEFHVIDDAATANAFCLPGGKVFVYTGIIPMTQDANGLAVVMAHEIGHVLANHGGERMSEQLVAELGSATLNEALAKSPEKTKTVFKTAYGIGSNIGFLLPYSRLQESEADRIGLILVARAGYDPAAAIPFWQRMNTTQGRPPQILSTHPAPQTRIKDIETFLPEAAHYSRSLAKEQ